MSKTAIQYTWDLSSLLASDDDPSIQVYREAAERAFTAFASKWQPRDDYLSNPNVLLEAIQEYEALDDVTGIDNDDFYFSLRSSVDSGSNAVKAGEMQANDFSQKLLNQVRFFELAIGQIEPSKQTEMLDFKPLSRYRHWLERLFAQSKYRLSEMEEKILGLKSMPAHSLWVQLTSNQLSAESHRVLAEDGKPVQASFEEVLTLMNSPHQKVRNQAAKVFNQILSDNLYLATAELNAVLANKKIDDELRGFVRVDQSRLIQDDVEGTMIDALVAAVSGYNQLSHRFYKLKAQLLGKTKLLYHERNLPIAEPSAALDYPAARDLVEKVFTNLDPDFGSILRAYQKNRQIDVYPRTGKHSGAFCASNLKNQPVFVLLNFTSKLRDVSTIAHEMGHAIHAEYTFRQQNSLNVGHSMATAEVASTFMEDFVFDELMGRASEEDQLALRVNRINDDISTIFRQIAFYRFEQELHTQYRQNGYLSSEEIGKLFQVQMQAYMGPSVEQSKGSQNWWLHVPHFRSFFYVYSYASGLLVSKALQERVRKHPETIADFKRLLGYGLSLSPADQFAAIGIDITDKAFWASGLDKIAADLDATEKLARKLGKID